MRAWTSNIKTFGQIDIESEDLVSMAEARHLFGPDVQRHAIANYMNVGSSGVRLESVIVNGQKMTSVQAIERFKSSQPPFVKRRKWQRND